MDESTALFIGWGITTIIIQNAPNAPQWCVLVLPVLGGLVLAAQEYNRNSK